MTKETQKTNVQGCGSVRRAFEFLGIRHLSFVILAWLLSLAVPQAPAQSYAIDWFTVDGGGGTSSGGVYSLSGTLGQPDANTPPMTGGNFSLTGGFWSLFAVQ